MLGKRIKEARKACGMTQKELGLLLGFPENSATVRIAQYESETRMPKAETLQAMADIFGVTPTYLTTPSPSSSEEIAMFLRALKEQGLIQVVLSPQATSAEDPNAPKISVAFKDDLVNAFLAGFLNHNYIMQHMQNQSGGTADAKA